MKQTVIIIGLLVFLVACAPAQQKAELPKAQPVDEAMQKEMAETMEQGLIAGDVSKYYDWDKAKFDQAVKDGKTVLLEFSASWCGVCKAQEPHFKAAFEELDDPDVVGFKIHYKDDQTTDEHSALAQQYQIPYQHTKVVLKDGKVVLKSPESWTKDKFLQEMRRIQGG
jgi:thiol-disulfide isomerase/thioredoxin